MSFLCFSSFRLLALILGSPAPGNLSTPGSKYHVFVSTQPTGVVLTYPYDKYEKFKFTKNPHPPLCLRATSYFQTLFKQITYLEDEMNLASSGFDWQSRRQNSLDFFKQLDIFKDQGFLVNNQIDYIYLVDDLERKS